MLFKSKLKATTIHLGLSLVIFAVALYLIVFQWYPGFLFRSDGGWQGLRLMAGVDLVLGPLLTFIIFNPTKTRRELTVDFSFIGLAQTAALIWGFYAVHEERPVALVHWDKTFYPITVKSLRAQNKTLDDLDTFGEQNPRLIFAKPPEDTDSGLQLFLNSFTGDLAEYEQFQLFQPLVPYFKVVAEKQQDITKLVQRRPEIATAWQALKWVKASDGREWVYVPFRGKYEDRVLVFSGQGELLGALPADPAERI